jgi:HEAT repeat protein
MGEMDNSNEDHPSDGESAAGPGLSPSAAAAADWLRDLSRTAKTIRLYQPANPVVEESRARFASATTEATDRFGGWTFRITPEEIFIGEEMIVHPPRRGPARGEAAQRLLSELPFRLYRDGVREIGVLPGIPRRDIDALVDALAQSWTDRDRADDIVTSLWQANPTHVRVEAAPPEQPLFVATGTGEPEVSERGLGLGLGLPPLATDIRAQLGDRGGAVGLHRESGLEDTPPPLYLSAIRAYETLQLEAAEARERILRAWRAEASRDWLAEATDILEQVRAADSRPATVAALSRFVVTGVAQSIDRGGWSEANRFLHQLGRLDPTGEAYAEPLGDAIADRSDLDLGETLDGALPGDIGDFFTLLFSLGTHGIPLALAALRGARLSRTRAAACASLAHLCADHPRLLEPALQRGSPDLVAHIVSVLGHIGGHEAGALCALVARDPNVAVTRELAQAIPAFPDPERTGLILELLASPDSQTVLLALRSARRERSERVARAILDVIESPDFDGLSEELRRTMFQTLTDVGDASAVPALEAQLTQGGWFARPSWRRTAAGQALARLGIPEAREAIARGRTHKSEAVRSASGDPDRRAG